MWHITVPNTPDNNHISDGSLNESKEADAVFIFCKLYPFEETENLPGHMKVIPSHLDPWTHGRHQIQLTPTNILLD